MKANQKWLKMIVLVVLALASLSSIATSAPHRDRLLIYYGAPVEPDYCAESNIDRFAQYLAAVRWGDEGAAMPVELSVGCGDGSIERFKQYIGALEGAAFERVAAPVAFEGSLERFAQYLAAVDPAFSADKHDLARFKQYLAAIDQ